MTAEIRCRVSRGTLSTVARLLDHLGAGPRAAVFLAAILLGVMSPGWAATDSPFGEPEMVLPIPLGPNGYELDGPYGVNPVGPGGSAGTAIFLAGRGGESAPLDLGYVLWRTDGTAEGTHPVLSPGKSFLQVLPTRGKYHWLQELRDGRTVALWRTNGTANGTMSLADGLFASGDYVYHSERRSLFFSAGPFDPNDPDAVYLDLEPWVSDGTRSGTRLLRDLVPGGGSRARSYREFGRDVVFLATDPATFATGLWRSDGTTAGTRLVAVPPGSSFVSLYVVGDTVFLVAEAPETPGAPVSLWASDGTPAGTLQVRSFGPRTPGAFQLRARLSGDLGDGRSLWTVETGDVPASLWVTDGTAAGTVQLMPLVLSAPGVHPQPVLPYEGAFYFRADDGTTGQELWRTDGTPEGTAPAFETCPGPCSDLFALRRLQDGFLVIWARDEAHGLEEWITDGTAEGTEVLLDLCPGPCSPDSFAPSDVDGYRIFSMRTPHGGSTTQLWGTDFTPEGTRQLTDFPEGVTSGTVIGQGPVHGRHLFLAGTAVGPKELWALTVPTEPAPPLGPWLAAPSVPGFEFKVRITGGAASIAGAREPSCIPETLCVSGALAGRSEVFLRVVGPKPNGLMWPTLVKFSTSTVEVWVRQDGTGEVRYYRLEGARPGVGELPGLFDRSGFEPVAGGAASLVPGLSWAGPLVLAAGSAPEPPDAAFTSEHFPGYRFRVRITYGDQVQEVRKEAACIEETLCLSGAFPGRSEVFVRLVGPKPNGRMWPTIVKFTTSTVEVWIEQVATGEERYYRIEGARPGTDDLTGVFDRNGFEP